MEIYGPRSSKMSNNEKRLEKAILDHNPPGFGPGVEIFAVEQHELYNCYNPDYPYHIDFMLCMWSFCRAGGVFSRLFMEADDSHFHVINRAGDYKRDISNLWYGTAYSGSPAPTLRFDSERIYKQPHECIGIAVERLREIFEDQNRRVWQEYVSEYEHVKICDEVEALRKQIYQLHLNVNHLLKANAKVAFEVGLQATLFEIKEDFKAILSGKKH